MENNSGKNISFLRAMAPFIIMLLILASCNTKDKKELERLEQERASLQQQIDLNNENVTRYFADLNEIEENLRAIKQKENVISRNASGDLELGVRQQDLINQDIKVIGELMEKNRSLINNLNERLRNSDTRIKGFEESIQRLNRTIQEKEQEIEMMRNQLANMNIKVEFLATRLDDMEKQDMEKARRLEMQTMEMHTAYYAVGSRKELTQNNIITREGGFLGLGRTERLNADFNQDFFTRVDITRVSEITINGQKPEIITSHPADSYQLVTVDGETYLEIKKPEAFWTASRYLVIQVK
jgi:predicted  nucleic acid-binding Zn-ribbon protein